MSDVPGQRGLELVIEPRNDEYGPDDDRWRAQVVGIAVTVETATRGFTDHTIAKAGLPSDLIGGAVAVRGGDAANVLPRRCVLLPCGFRGALAHLPGPGAIRYTNTPRCGSTITNMVHNALPQQPRSGLWVSEHHHQQPDPDEEQEEPQHRHEHLAGRELSGLWLTPPPGRPVALQPEAIKLIA
jgi:hypothetical protein